MSRLRLFGRWGGLGALLLGASLAACGQMGNSDSDSNDFGLDIVDAANLAGAKPPEVQLDDNDAAANPGAGANATAEANRVSNQVTANEQDGTPFELDQAQKRIEALEQRVAQHGKWLSQLSRNPKPEAQARRAERPLLPYLLVLPIIALLAAGYWWWRRAGRKGDKEPAHRTTFSRLDALEARLSTLEAGSGTPPGPPPPPPPPPPTAAIIPQPGAAPLHRNEEPKAWPLRETIESDRFSPPPPPPPPPAPPAADRFQDRRLTGIGTAFTHMASKEMPTRDDYEMALRSFGTLYDARVDGEGRVELNSFTGGSATTLLAAIDLSQGDYALVPSYYFVKEFGITYHEAIEATTFLKGIFTLEKDNSLALRCERAALVRTGAAGERTLVESGVLAGFTSAR